MVGVSSVEGTVNITDCSFQCFALTYFSFQEAALKILKVLFSHQWPFSYSGPCINWNFVFHNSIFPLLGDNIDCRVLELVKVQQNCGIAIISTDPVGSEKEG